MNVTCTCHLSNSLIGYLQWNRALLWRVMVVVCVCWFFLCFVVVFLQQDLWLRVAYGCVSSAQVVTCEKAGPSLRKKESTILIYNTMNLEWLLKKYMDIKNTFWFRGTLIPFLCDWMVTFWNLRCWISGLPF